jgi:hypothetical protein
MDGTTLALMDGTSMPRALTIVLMAAGLVATSTRAATPPELVCVQQAKADLTICVAALAAAREQCNAGYLSSVPPCFGANAPCASTCITDKDTCDSGPEGRRDACTAVCDQHATAIQTDCRQHRGQAVQTCLLRTKLVSIKCKQKCVRRATLPLQRCSTQLGACLKSCVAKP